MPNLHEMELVIQSELLLTRAWVKVSELAYSIAVAFNMGRAYVLMLRGTAVTFALNRYCKLAASESRFTCGGTTAVRLIS